MTEALEQSDLTSLTWQKLKILLEERVEMLRKKNDGNLDAVQTASLRGEIKALKGILVLDKAAPNWKSGSA